MSWRVAGFLRPPGSLVVEQPRSSRGLRPSLANLRRARNHAQLRRPRMSPCSTLPTAAVAELTKRIDGFLRGGVDPRAHRRLVKYVTRDRANLLPFLTTPRVQATPWRAEQASRPMVVNRKNWGGNQTRQGADTTPVIASVPAHRHPVAPRADRAAARRPPISPPPSSTTPPTTTSHCANGSSTRSRSTTPATRQLSTRDHREASGLHWRSSAGSAIHAQLRRPANCPVQAAS